MCPRNIKEYNFKKILIIGGTLSENLLYIPAIKQIKNAFQDASIDIVVAPDSEEFVFENPLFSEYIILDKKKSMFGFIRRARRKRYDLIISFKDEFLAFFLRGKFKLSLFFKDFFSEKIFTYESERILNFLEPFLGEYEDKLNLSFNVSKKDRDDVDIILKSAELKNSDTLVVINPGHLPIKKRIDISHYLAVIKELVKIYDAKIILAGTAKDKKNLKKIKELIEEKNNVYDFSEKLNLGSFAA